MPKTKISEYSTTNTDNSDIEGINIAEGCAPSGINNAIRELMVHLKEFQTGASGDSFTFAGAVTFTGNINSSGTNTFSGSNVISVGAGTSASPSIYFASDTNTGIFSPAADTIAFAEGGAEAMRIDSSGNVGIGTSSPSYNLDVYRSSTTTAGITARNDTSTAYLYSVNAASYAGTITNTPFGFITNNAERMRIDSSGNVGIGTSSPSTRLSIVSGTNAGITVNDGTVNTILYNTSSANGTVGTTTNHPMAIFTNNTERMRITSGGEVLIGTATTRNKLTVTGTVTTTPTLGTASGTAFFCNTDTAFGMMFGVSGGGQGWIQQQRVDGTGTAYALYLQPVGGETLVAGTTDNGAYNLQCNGTGVWGAGAYVNGSDARIKEDVAPIDSGLDVVEKLNPVTYRYKEDWSKDQSVQTGFIAQELLTALDGKNYVDGIVQQGGSEGYYSVAYQNIIPILTKAIQELKAEVDALKAELANK